MELRLKICSKAALFLKILVLWLNMWKKTGRNKGLKSIMTAGNGRGDGNLCYC